MTKMVSNDTESIEYYLCLVGLNIRLTRGIMSQGDLAKKAGVSRSTIQKAETGTSIEFDNLLKIAKALNIDPANLFLSTGDRKDITYKSKLVLDIIFEKIFKIGEKNEKREK